MREIHKTIADQHPRCPCCGARGRAGEWDKTCDGICHRAWVKGITRGLEIELELRRSQKQPYPERQITETEDDDYGKLQLEAEFANRMSKLFDNPALLHV